MTKLCKGLFFTVAMLLMAVPAQANTYTTADVPPSDLFSQPAAAAHQLNALISDTSIDLSSVCMMTLDSLMHRLERVTQGTFYVAMLVRLNTQMISPEDEKQTLYPISSTINDLGKSMGADLGFLGPSLNQTCPNDSVLPALISARKAYKLMAGFLDRMGQKLPRK